MVSGVTFGRKGAPGAKLDSNEITTDDEESTDEPDWNDGKDDGELLLTLHKEDNEKAELDERKGDVEAAPFHLSREYSQAIKNVLMQGWSIVAESLGKLTSSIIS